MQMTGILVKQFGLTAFRDWQLKIIQAVLARKNTFVLQPTGSGKSLCFLAELCVLQSLTEGNGYYSSIAAQILPHIETSDSRVLVYTNFVKDAAQV